MELEGEPTRYPARIREADAHRSGLARNVRQPLQHGRQVRRRPAAVRDGTSIPVRRGSTIRLCPVAGSSHRRAVPGSSAMTEGLAVLLERFRPVLSPDDDQWTESRKAAIDSMILRYRSAGADERSSFDSELTLGEEQALLWRAKLLAEEALGSHDPDIVTASIYAIVMAGAQHSGK